MPYSFDNWHGIFYMLSRTIESIFNVEYRLYGRTDTAGHTKAFFDPVMDHWGGGQMAKRLWWKTMFGSL